MIHKRSLIFLQSFLTCPFFTFVLLSPCPPPKPALSHATLVASPIPKPLPHTTVVAMPSPVPALTHTTPVRFFFQPRHSQKKIKSSLGNDFSAKVKSILHEFVFNVCTIRADESGINLSGTLTMKPETTSQAILKVLTLIKSFDTGRTKWWHFCFSSLNCSFSSLLATTFRRGSSADARGITFF